MDDVALHAQLLSSLRSSAGLIGLGRQANTTFELDELSAAIAPATPDRSIMNSVAYERTDALEGALTDLAHAYAEEGIRAWTVWTPERDTRAAGVLEAAGHKLDAAPRAMAIELADLGAAPPEPSWSPDWDLEAAGLVNDRAWGDADGTWASVLGELPEDAGHLYLVRGDAGEPQSMVLMHDHDDDCVFWFAATVPDARGRGHVSGLLHRALSDARKRGCRTSTTQASPMGAPIYARLGYRDLGALYLYERRRS
jgi:ribosomal protein S18 acetylase RimI-like enzyme